MYVSNSNTLSNEYVYRKTIKRKIKNQKGNKVYLLIWNIFYYLFDFISPPTFEIKIDRGLELEGGIISPKTVLY